MKHLTTPDNIRNDVRPVSKHLDDSRINIYIKEAEQLNVKSRIGDALYIDLIKYVNANDEELLGFPTEYKKLLHGGNYFANGKCEGEEGDKNFVGLIETLNYYVYARIVKNNNETVTRLGFNEKNDDYSSSAELKKQLAAEKDALSVADGYMSDCIDYLRANSKNIPKFKKAGKAKNRLRISIIGD